MEKRLRSSLKTSADEFLSSATKSSFLNVKPSLKTLIHSLKPSSDVVSSLPLSLHQSISKSITLFKRLSESSATASAACSPPTPPAKFARRTSQRSKIVDDVSGMKDEEKRSRDAKTRVSENLQIYAYVALMCVTRPDNVFSAADLLPAVRELHDNLVLFEMESNLLSLIAKLCEEWWKGEFPGREGLISQSLPFLLSKSLTSKKKVDVHRVYALREAFTLFDFEDESIEDLKLLLIRCLISPLYLKMDEGRRFLAFLFGLSRQLLKEALAMIRSQIPFGRKSMLEAYADIVFRAWKAAEGESKWEIENEFLQTLVESSIHASTGPFAASIRRILGGFISPRTTDGVDKLLFNLAEPVIFRSLQVANSNVRQNASNLLIDVFSLEDPDATREVKDTLVQKQFFLIEKLLMDECPDIRAVAVEGSCRILHLFWEIIPSSTITKLITKILDDMSHDVCNEVRLSTINGIIYLLGNPQSHEILKVLLPRLGHLILDSALSTRVAIVDLLLLLKDIRNFQFHKVVHLDVLLSTLANDQSLVAQKLTKLLLPSYFPPTVTPEEACQRCVTLIKRSSHAGARFCEFAFSEGASSQFLNSLFKVLINLGLSNDKMGADQIEGILISAAHICNSLGTEAVNKAAFMEELSGKKLMNLFSAAPTGRARSSVCNIITTICPDVAEALREKCIALVTRCTGITDNQEKQTEVRAVHRMMLACDGVDYMIEAFTNLLQRTAQRVKRFAERTGPDSTLGKKRKVKSVFSARSKRAHGKKTSDTSTTESGFDEDYAVSVGLSWQLKDLLASDDSRKAVLGSRSLESAFHALKVIAEVSIMQCLQLDYMNTSPVLAYTSLGLHMSIKNLAQNDSNKHGSKMKGSTGSASDLQHTVLEQTIDHLLRWTDKLLKTSGSEKSSKMPLNASHTGKKHPPDQLNQTEGGSLFTKQKRVSNTVKILTAILKFISDSLTINLIPQNQERCLNFARNYVAFAIVNLRQHSDGLLKFDDEDLKETFLCLKSSFTYSAKLLNLVLSTCSESSPSSPQVQNLSNDLFDLIAAIDEHLGSKYGTILLSVARVWLPDLILALCPFSSDSDPTKFSYPSWPLIVAKIEIVEADSDEEEGGVCLRSRFSTFRKLAETTVGLVRANRGVLDAFGRFLLAGAAVAMEKRDFEWLFGILRFVCGKLVKEKGEWGEMKSMLECVGEIYPRMMEMEEENERLEKAKALVEPVWRCYVDDTPEEGDFSDD